MTLLECLDSATQLTSLSLYDNEFDDDGPREKFPNSMLYNLFMTDRSYKTLTKLDLSDNELKSLISVVQALLKIPWLKDLNLSSNCIADDSIDCLLDWIDRYKRPDEPPLRQQLQIIKLEKLNLYNCYIRYIDTVTEFLTKSHLSSIKKLDLRLNLFDNKNDCQLHANELFQDRDIEILISE